MGAGSRRRGLDALVVDVLCGRLAELDEEGGAADRELPLERLGVEEEEVLLRLCEPLDLDSLLAARTTVEVDEESA